MANQRGNIQDRMRCWVMMRNRKKKKKQKQEQEMWNAYLEEKRNQGIYIKPVTKKYHMITIIFHSIFGLFLGLFEPKKKTFTSSQLLENIVQLQKEIEQNEALQITDAYCQKVEQQEKLLEQVMQRQKKKEERDFMIQECIERLHVVKSKLQNQKSENSLIESESKVETTQNKWIAEQPVSNRELVKEEVQPVQQRTLYTPPISVPPQSYSLEKKESNVVEKEKIEKKESNVAQKEKPEKKATNTDTQEIKKKVLESTEMVPIEESVLVEAREKRDYKEYLLDTNKKLKKQQEALKVCGDKIKQAQTPKELYAVESTILWIQNQLLQLESRYKEIATEREFQQLKFDVTDYTIDTFNLLESNQAIKKLLDDCKKKVAEIEEKAIVIPVKPKKTEKSKEKKEKKEEKQREQIYLDIQDFEQLRTQVQEDLKRQLGDIKEMQFAPFTRQSNGFFRKLLQFVSHTAFLLTPMVFFKNKLAGMLTSSIILSNRIRSMRQVVEQKEALYETGENLLIQIRSKQECMEAIHNRLQDSLLEIEQLKQSFAIKYKNAFPVETEIFFNQLDYLESQIIEKTVSIGIDQRRLSALKQKYQKVLKK